MISNGDKFNQMIELVLRPNKSTYHFCYFRKKEIGDGGKKLTKELNRKYIKYYEQKVYVHVTNRNLHYK